MAPDPAAADLYERLGVGRSAGEDEIKRAYRKLALQYHPDRCADDTATATFQHISEAYAVLSDSAKRRNYDEFGEADVDDFDLDDFMDAAFGEGGSFADVFAELMAMGGMEAEDEEEMGDMQRSFESYLKASMGKGDPDGKVLMPDGSRVPFAALADSEDMLSLMMMAGGLGDEVDEDEMEELMEMMGAMAGGGRGGFGALLGGGFGPRVRVKSGSRGPSSARNRRKKASKKAKAAAASASGAASASAASGSASSGGASSRVGEQEEVPFSTLWLECAKANDTSGLARVLAAHPEVLTFQQPNALGNTALHWAAVRNSLSAARWLLDKGLSVDVQNKVGSTPLHSAAANGCMQVASLLLERRADVSLLDSSGETAREKAMERGHTAVLQLLTQAAAAVTATPSAHAPPQPPDSSGPPSGGAAPRPTAVAPAADQSVSTLLDELGTELARAAASMPPGERAKLAASLSLVAAAKAAAARSAL